MLKKIRSKLILRIVFQNLKKRRKMNLIKYNKNYLSLLNITLKDFQDLILLKELKQKYNVHIEDTDIKQLNLINVEKIIEVIEFISQIEFKGLINLVINNNN